MPLLRSSDVPVLLKWLRLLDSAPMTRVLGAGLARRIFLAFLAAAVLPTAIAGAIGVWMSFDKLRSATVSGLEHELAARGSGLLLFFESVSSELRFLATQPQAMKLVGEGEVGAAETERLQGEIGHAYARLVRAQPHIYQLRLLDVKGVERVRVDRKAEGVVVLPPRELQDKSDRYYFREALARPAGTVYVSPLDLNVERGQVEKPERPVIRLATVISGPGGRPAGVVIVNVHAGVLIGPVQEMVQAREGTAYLFDPSGHFLARGAGGGRGLVMQPVALSGAPAAVLSAVASNSAGSLDNAGWIWVHAPVYFAGKADGAPHWSMAVALPESALLLQALDLAKLYAILAAALVIAALAGYSISRRLVGPLQDLAREADAIAAGDFGRRVHIGGRDEIALLGERFNLMATRLQATLSQLEQHGHRLEAEIADRTRELMGERALLAAVLRHTSDAIAALRADGELLFANQAAERLVGAASGQGASPPAALMQRLAADGRAGREEIAIGERTFSVSRDSLPPVQGAAHMVIVARDVTEERQVADAKREFDRQLFQMDKLATMGELAMGVAHEIGNPLAGMKAVVQSLLLEPALAAEMREDLSRLEAEIDRLARFLGRFRRLAAPPQLNLSPQQLAPAVDDMLFWVRRQARASGVQVAVEIDADLPPLRADPAQLREVLLNLFVNALQAMPHGGQLTVRGAAEGGEALIAVQDTGRGITPEVQAKIFQPFFTTRPDGSGLGLAVCSQVVADHGGRIEVASRPGDTRFLVHWPLYGTRAAEATLA